jgi:thiamine biosynthesis lipoprotein
VGLTLERAGFNREYRTGAEVTTQIATGTPPSYQDVLLDLDRRTVTLKIPLVLDLGAIAKGMAIDLAAAELAGYPGYAVCAGGDLFAAGLNERGRPWQVGILHPRQPGRLLDTLAVSNVAVCTSGDYLRRVRAGAITHHLLDPRSGVSARSAASVTVIAPTAMLADALATAAFVLGPRRGIPFLERAGVQGLIVTPRVVQKATAGYGEYKAATAETKVK